MEHELNLPNLLRSRLTMVATLAALKAGDLLKKVFGTEMEVSSKEGLHNLVTEWDKKVETSIIEFISTHFPEHTFLAEESGLSGKADKSIQWIIDPLDGTVNFVHKIPMFAVSIAASFQNEVISGVIYNPLLNELFIAEKGSGAYLNGDKLSVSSIDVLDRAMIATGFPYNLRENPLSCIDHFTNFAKMGVPIRRLGSAALDLAYIAAGRFDAFWEVSLNPWDYAAGKLLIEEAGGNFSNFEGNALSKLEKTPVIASNKLLHEQLVKNILSTMNKTDDNEPN